MSCSLCDNTGWRPIQKNGVRWVTECDHGAARAPELPVVSTEVDAVFRAKLTGDERRIHDVVMARRGKAQAIRIREIIDIVWPQGLVPRTFNEEQDCQREVKRVVAMLREHGRYLIAGHKGKPYGLFIPATDLERQECRDRLFEEGWKLIKASQLFVRNVNLGEILRERAARLGGGRQ